MCVKPVTVTPAVRLYIVPCVLARYLLRSIDRNGFNFFGFYEFNLDYDRNFTLPKKKTGSHHLCPNSK